MPSKIPKAKARGKGSFTPPPDVPVKTQPKDAAKDEAANTDEEKNDGQ